MKKTKTRKKRKALAIKSIKTRKREESKQWLQIHRHFKPATKATGPNLITEKNEWGDYKVKALQIRQLERDAAQEQLNESVGFPFIF